MKRTLSYILSFAFICSSFMITVHKDGTNENLFVSAEDAAVTEKAAVTEAVSVTEVPKVTDAAEVTEVPEVTEAPTPVVTEAPAPTARHPAR